MTKATSVNKARNQTNWVIQFVLEGEFQWEFWF